MFFILINVIGLTLISIVKKTKRTITFVLIMGAAHPHKNRKLTDFFKSDFFFTSFNKKKLYKS
jgi:hypothetical protein